MNLTQVRELWNNQDFDGVVNACEQIQANSLDIIETLEMRYIQGFSLLQLNEKDKVKALLDDSLPLSDPDSNLTGFMQMYFLKGSLEYMSGNIHKTVEILSDLYQIIKDKDFTDNQKNIAGDILNRLGASYTTLGKYEEAIGYLIKGLEFRELLGQTNKIGATMYNLGTTFFQAGRLDEAVQYLEGTQRIFDEVGNILGQAYCKMELGGIYQNQGLLQQALENFLESHALYKKHGTDTQIAWSLTDLGNIYQTMGYIGKSLEYYRRAIPLYQKIGDARVFGNHLRAMAISYRYQGDITEAIRLNNQALELYREVDNQPFVARALYQLGGDYLEKGEPLKALNYFKDAQVLFEEGENIDYLTRTLFEKIQVYIDLKSYNQIPDVIQTIYKYRDQTSSELIDQMYRLVNAQYKTLSNRITDLADAQREMQRIVNEPIRDIRVITITILSLAQQLIREYGIFHSEIQLKELEELLHLGYELASTKNSPQLTIKLQLIHSNLYLISLSFDDAERLLVKSKELAGERQLEGLSHLISQMEIRMASRIEELSKLANEKDVDIILREMGLDQFISNLLNNRYGSALVLDEPLLISIIADSGISLLNRTYVDIPLKDQMLGGFISALSSFADETFQSRNILDSISISGRNLKIKSLDGFKLCYLYSGSALGAEERIIKLINEIIKRPSFSEVIRQSMKNHEIISDGDVIRSIDQLFDY